MSTRSMLAQRVALLCTLCACASPPAGETLVAESLKSSAKSRAEDIHDLLTQQWHPRAVESEDPAHFEVPELRPLADEMLRVLGERIRGWKTKRSEPLPLDHIPVNADLSHLRPHIGRSLLTRRPFWTSEPDVDCMERAEAALRDQVNAPNYAALLDALTLATHALSGCRVTSEDFVQEMRDLFARVAKLSPQVFLLAQMQANAPIDAELFVRLRPLPVYLIQASTQMVEQDGRWTTPFFFWVHDLRAHAIAQIFSDLFWMLQDVRRGGIAARSSDELVAVAEGFVAKVQTNADTLEMLPWVESKLGESDSVLNALDHQVRRAILSNRFRSFGNYLQTVDGQAGLNADPEAYPSIFFQTHETSQGLFFIDSNCGTSTPSWDELRRALGYDRLLSPQDRVRISSLLVVKGNKLLSIYN